jgi:hypothetical protein
MDLRAYYQKIRKLESEITEESAVVVSNSTGDGGKAGVLTEVPRHTAARMLAEDRARLASEDEATEYRRSVQSASEKARLDGLASKVQVAVLSEQELRALRGAGRPLK